MKRPNLIILVLIAAVLGAGVFYVWHHSFARSKAWIRANARIKTNPNYVFTLVNFDATVTTTSKSVDYYDDQLTAFKIQLMNKSGDAA